MTIPTATRPSLGRIVYDYSASIAVVSMMLISFFAVAIPRPRTADELLVWLGFGVSILSLLASIARLAGHRRVSWPGSEFPTLPEGDDPWTMERRDAMRQEQRASDATRSGYDYLGKLLSLHAALFALITTVVHVILLHAG